MTCISLTVSAPGWPLTTAGSETAADIELTEPLAELMPLLVGLFLFGLLMVGDSDPPSSNLTHPVGPGSVGLVACDIFVRIKVRKSSKFEKVRRRLSKSWDSNFTISLVLRFRLNPMSHDDGFFSVLRNLTKRFSGRISAKGSPAEKMSVVVRWPEIQVLLIKF